VISEGRIVLSVFNNTQRIGSFDIIFCKVVGNWRAFFVKEGVDA
jgi:hypothetical protein